MTVIDPSTVDRRQLDAVGPIVAVFDSNAVDPLVDDAQVRSLVGDAVAAGTLRVLYTHVTWDELGATPDLGRREALREAIQTIGERVSVAE